MIRIQAENFRSYPVLDWVIPNGLTLLDGENLDTGGSNMVGKSSIIDAIFWARYGWLPRWGGPKGGSPDSVIRRKNGEQIGKASVKLTEKIGSDEIVIERSRPSKLIVRKNGAEIKGVDQEQLNALLGISPERYLVCVYLAQNRSRSFYWMSDSERTEILSVVANLEGLDRGLESAKEQKNISQNEIAKISGVLSVLEPKLSGFAEQKIKIESDLIQARERLSEVKEKSIQAEVEYQELAPNLKNTKDSLVYEKTNFLNDEIEELKREGISLDHLITKLNFYLKSESIEIEPVFEMNVNAAFKQIKEIKNLEKEHQKTVINNSRFQELAAQETELAEAALLGKCKHCNQELSAEKRHAQAMVHIKKAQEYRSRICALPTIPNIEKPEKEYELALAQFATRKAEIEAKPKEIRQEIEIVQQKKNSVESKIKEIQSQILLIESQIQSQIVEQLRLKKQIWDDLKGESERIENEVKRLEKSLLDHDNSFREIKDEIQSAQAEMKKYDFKLNQSLDLIDFFGPRGYRVIAFDGLVQRISDRAGQLLSLMTESLYSTRLDSVGQDSKGNQKLVLKPIIIKGGVEVPKDDLSGGAETRVALSYDVAIAEAAGNGHPLFLDESLDGMDSVGKSEAMVLLEEVSKTRPVIVIDHTSEFKAQFSQVIRVVYQSEESRLEN